MPAHDSAANDIDLFAGPGGWDEGIRPLGIRPLGIEWDEAACATARAAGHRRLQADIAQLDPADFGPVRGLIASPPCQGFSMAGKGRGRADAELLLAAIPRMADRDVRPDLRDRMTDPRSILVLEPLRWALALRPDWMAWEQVPAVLPIWEACADVLRSLGVRENYSVACAVLNAEQYGVPQTRRRAILIARREAKAELPTPTHSRYYPRTPDKLDPGVAKWVSMGEVLGWTGPWAIRSNYGTGGDPAARGVRTLSEPAAAVTGKVGRNKWVVSTGVNTAIVGPGPDRDAAMADGRWRDIHKPQERPIDAPAPTVDGKAPSAWKVHPAGERPVYRASNQAHAARRDLHHPAPTVVGGHRSNKVEWMDPAEAADPKASGVRVTVTEAAVLQTFPADYPWQGTKTARQRQVGDAVPPLLARAVVAAAVTGIAMADEDDAA